MKVSGTGVRAGLITVGNPPNKYDNIGRVHGIVGLISVGNPPNN